MSMLESSWDGRTDGLTHSGGDEEAPGDCDGGDGDGRASMNQGRLQALARVSW